MNRYPLWKNLLIGLVLLVGLLYTLPNFFGEDPAVQVSSGKATVQLSEELVAPIEQALQEEGIEHTGVFSDEQSLRFRFSTTDEQLMARDVIESTINPDPNNPDYIVALNLLPATPGWLMAIDALPMYLGLDLRGGVHFLLEVDMPGAITNRLEATAGDLRTLMRDERIRHAGITREGDAVELRFRTAEQRDQAREAIASHSDDLQLASDDAGEEDYRLSAGLTEEAEEQIREFALRQNISTLRNRINELGVAEPIIQQQGPARIVVQLPGVQDVARAKDILGRTATLEIRLVEDSPGELEDALDGQVPFGTELYRERGGGPILVRNEVVLTGDRLTDAQPGFDNQTNEPAVFLTLDSAGSRIFRDVTRENVGRRMAILLIEKGQAEVVTAPVIRSEIGGGRVQISGQMTTDEANNIALLLRAGALAAPMEIIEERTIGPSLGAANIEAGFTSVMWGFIAIMVFMTVYYRLFGLVSSIALTSNLMLLVAILSMLQATLTLPGMAAMALTLGMAIDANVLINERIREEIRNGVSPQAAITAGYDRAFDTILDANVTTLIAGIALLVFGSGPVRGFAVVHCIGILTSMFSAILISRMLVNFLYGRRRKIEKLEIG